MAEPCLCTAHAAADCDGGGRPLRADGCDCACHGGAEATDAVAATEPECTGETARWCPRHGDCTCPPREDWPDEFTFDGDDCPLHGERSTHADAGPAERLALEAMEHESVVAEVLRLRAELANVSARAAEVPGLSAELDRLRWELAVAMGEKTAGAQCLAEFERMAAKSTELLMRKIDTTLALEEAMRVGLEECERLRAIIARLVPHEYGVSHSHARAGTWDSENRADLSNKPCQRCHDFADAREALGMERWPPRGYGERATPADPCAASCGCGGSRG